MPLLQVLYFATRVSGLRYGGQNGHFLIFMAWGRYSYDWITDVFEEFFFRKDQDRNRFCHRNYVPLPYVVFYPHSVVCLILCGSASVQTALDSLFSPHELVPTLFVPSS